MFVTVDNSNTFFSDNPYYFCNDTKSPRTPDSQSSSRGFSLFKRRNSKGGSSPRPVVVANPERLITSANLDTTATMAFGSPRGSFNSFSSFSQHSFEMQPMHMHRQRSSNPQSCSEFRERLGSCNETHSSQCPGGGDHDEVFNPLTSPTSKSHRHHTLPSGGTRRHSLGNWAQHQHQHQQNASASGAMALGSPDEVPSMMAPRPPLLSPNKFRGSSHRRRDNCGTVNNASGASASGCLALPGCNMDDILIITAKHSERAYLRATFLKNHFDKITKQRGRKPFNFLHIKIDDGPFSDEIALKYQSTALQIVILCPALLALPHSFLMAQLSAIIRVEKVLAILLDVGEEKVREMHKMALPSYYKWRRCVVRDNDQVQISNILGIATDILGRALCQRPPCHDGSGSGSGGGLSRSFSSCSEGFTVLPKKVKLGQNKVVALLAEPLEKNDSLKLLVEKSGELIELRNFKCRNPYTLQFSIPEACMEISTMVEIRIEKNGKSLGARPIKCESRLISTMVEIRIEKNGKSLGARPIKCESRLRELEQLLRIEDSPIEFMCHALGIGPVERDALDQHLLQSFQRNMPPNFHLLSGPSERQPHFFTRLESSPEEYPTLLHFAARWGLNRLCIQLMECPGGDTACGVRNCAGRTPAELAEQEGHSKLAQNIVSFSEFHELTTMYHYFKGVSPRDSAQETSSAHPSANVVIGAVKSGKPPKQLPPSEYMEMSSGSERENTPEVRPKTETMAVSNLNYISVETEDENLQASVAEKKVEANKTLPEAGQPGPEQTTNELRINEPPYFQSNELNRQAKSQDEVDAAPLYQMDKFSQECSQLLENQPGNDYVLQPSNVPVAVSATASVAQDDGNYLFQPSNRPVEEHLRLGHCPSFARPSAYGGTLKRSASDASNARSNADDELAEIMHDFKNNVLSIRDVELLVERWKHRNDVQQSFREKQDQIDQLRREYERIQEQVRSQLKRETPFDRIKKFFSRSKPEPAAGGNDSLLDETKSSIATSCSFKSSGAAGSAAMGSSAAGRPISSLSLQSVSSSSSSSGRLSTGSNCSGASLGDSGTHSDHEERRFGSHQHCRMVDNYLVPPPPRPVFTPSSTPGDERHQIVFPSPMSSCQRLNTPTSPTGSEHYQMFPSNIPVYGSQPLASSQSSNYLNTIMEAKEQAETQAQLYQNQTGVTLQPIKLNERSNIIYGKLTKSHSANGCSSFKPKQVAVPCPQVGSIEVQAEVYQNVGDIGPEKTVAVAEEAPNYINC
ncbi:hypothetical protein KR018_010944 [Drosophila ironensis]|nr:hypothetical protein KR018_010944 [Drosophila ironensis]